MHCNADLFFFVIYSKILDLSFCQLSTVGIVNQKLKYLIGASTTYDDIEEEEEKLQGSAIQCIQYKKIKSMIRNLIIHTSTSHLLKQS